MGFRTRHEAFEAAPRLLNGAVLNAAPGVAASDEPQPRTSSTGSTSSVSAAVHRAASACGKNMTARPNGRSMLCTLSGCFISRKPKSVAGWCDVEIVRSMIPPSREEAPRGKHRGDDYDGRAARISALAVLETLVGHGLAAGRQFGIRVGDHYERIGKSLG